VNFDWIAVIQLRPALPETAFLQVGRDTARETILNAEIGTERQTEKRGRIYCLEGVYVVLGRCQTFYFAGCPKCGLLAGKHLLNWANKTTPGIGCLNNPE
jgi:hypothetical protein